MLSSTWSKPTACSRHKQKTCRLPANHSHSPKSNFAAGLGTQLDILQAAADVTRTRTTRLSAIYLHNAALARLDRAAGGESEGPAGEEGASEAVQPNDAHSGEQVSRIARPGATPDKKK